jgi:ribosome-associated protein
LAVSAARAAEEKKGENISVIHIGAQVPRPYADYLVIVTAQSDRQGQALAESIVRHVREETNRRPGVREGEKSWILLDYGDVVVHVFHEDARDYYGLEQIWSHAPRIAWGAPQRATP